MERGTGGWVHAVAEALSTDASAQLREEALALNDALAAHPELGSQEFESSKRNVELLRSHGLVVEYPFCGLATSFKTSVNPGSGRRKAALLAEYDALPELGHACGHCAGGSAAVLAILALHEIEPMLGDIQIDLIGTPDEETGGGKVLLAAAHAFDAYEFAAMVHMNDVNLSQINFSAIDGMVFEFRGKPAHAAFAPEKGRNAFNAARLFFDSVDMMRQHVPDKVRLHGYMTEGGYSSNTIPDFARIEFCTRAPRRRQLNDVTEWVKDCARAAAMATRTELKILPYGVDYDSFETGKEKNQAIVSCFEALGLDIDGETVVEGGSSDIASVDAVCPAFHPMLGIGSGLVAHTEEFAAAMTGPQTHQAIENGARVLIQLCDMLFHRQDLLERVKAESRLQHL